MKNYKDDSQSERKLIKDPTPINDVMSFTTADKPGSLTSDEGANPLPAVQMQPLTPIQASATIVNLLLATGPFSYPQGFVQLGPILSISLMLITCCIAYITATFMIEAISVANSEDDKRRTSSMFGETAYVSPIVQRKVNLADLDNKGSPFYIRQKIEIGMVA
jgi:hypothetical protein